jgi:uncharacterized membrane protein
MVPLGHLHPMLVHFPIALVVFGFIADIAALVFKKETFLAKTGFYLLIIGTLAAGAATLAGILFTSELAGEAEKVRELHELFAYITLGILSATLILRIFLKIKKLEDSNLKWLAICLYGFATVAVMLTGLYGGTLVYNFMMPL